MSQYTSLLLISILFFLQPSVYGQVINVTTQDDFGKLLDDNNLVVVNFYTTWCGACKAVKEPFSELSQAHATKNVAFAQVDIDALNDLKNMYGIESIPHFLFFKKGKSIKQKQFESLDTFKEDMMNEVQQLQNINNILAPEHKGGSAITAHQKTSAKQNGSIANFLELLMIPITFIMNLLEKLFDFIKGWFA